MVAGSLLQAEAVTQTLGGSIAIVFRDSLKQPQAPLQGKQSTRVGLRCSRGHSHRSSACRYTLHRFDSLLLPASILVSATTVVNIVKVKFPLFDKFAVPGLGGVPLGYTATDA